MLQDQGFAADVEKTTLPKAVCEKSVLISPKEDCLEACCGDALEWRSSKAVLTQMSGRLSSEGAMFTSGIPKS